MASGPPQGAGSEESPWVPATVAFVVACVAAAVLARHNAPRPDEFHTLSHVHGSLGDLWTSYRRADDATPPLAYLFSWSAARVLGTSLFAVRIPFALSWAVAAATLTVLTRRAGAWASLAAGLVPTATALVYLGAYARAYAPVLACLALAAWTWQRAAGSDAPLGWLVALGALGAAATALHYAAILVVVLLSVATAVLARGGPHWRGRVIAPLVGGTVALGAIGVVASQAVDAQRGMPRSARLLDALAFWPSAAGPAWPPLVLAAAVVGSAFLIGRRSDGPLEPSGLSRDLLGFGWASVVVVPVATVGAMLVASGTYFHRYGVGALVGAAIVVAQVLRVVPRRRVVAPVVVGLLVVAGAMATRDAADQMLSIDQASALAGRLQLDDGTSTPVVVVNEYDFLLLRRYGGDALRERLELATAPGVVGSPDPVDVAGLLAAGDGFELVGSAAEVDALIADAGWSVATADYPRPGSPRVLEHVQVRAAS